jgi:hypothetical protein
MAASHTKYGHERGSWRGFSYFQEYGSHYINYLRRKLKKLGGGFGISPGHPRRNTRKFDNILALASHTVSAIEISTSPSAALSRAVCKKITPDP